MRTLLLVMALIWPLRKAGVNTWPCAINRPVGLVYLPLEVIYFMIIVLSTFSQNATSMLVVCCKDWKQFSCYKVSFFLFKQHRDGGKEIFAKMLNIENNVNRLNTLPSFPHGFPNQSTLMYVLS